MANVEDEVPPLEDIPAPTDATAQAAPAPPVVKYVQPTTTPSAQTKEKEKDKDRGFAGMKKGFLNSSGSSSTPKPKPKTEEIVEIKRKPAEEPSFFRIIKEPDRKKREEEEEEEKAKANWVTDDILNQIHQDESLSKYFSNPSFMEAVGLFQRNPQEALAKYGNNKEIMQFFDRMVKLMGQHFTSPKSQNEQKSAASLHADAEVNRLLQDDSVRQLLIDPEVMQLMKLLREEPEKAHAMVRSANEPMRAKIERLVQLGLLSPSLGKK